jgi:ELWxxDGT repeat protein
VTQLLAFAGMAFFTGKSADGRAGLWRSDGSAQGTVLVFDGETPSLTVLGDRMFFLRRAQGGVELWKTDGTGAGTEVFDLVPGGGYAVSLTSAGSRLFAFLKTDTTRLATLWASDGTQQGTLRLRDLDIDVVALPVDLRGRAFFDGNDGTTGFELWTSDGFPEGTRLVRDIYPGGESAFPRYLAAGDTTLFFLAADGVHGTSLWRTEGGSATTRRVYDFGSFRYFQDVATIGDVAYFLPDAQLVPRGLWRSDGTAEGTFRLCSIPSSGGEVVRVGGTVFFAGDDGVHGQELWASDGTPEGTRLVADINPGPAASWPEKLSAVGGALFFKADDGQHGFEPWRSDGTTGGTRLVADVLPGRTGSHPGQFIEAGGHVYFTAPWTQDDLSNNDLGVWVLTAP